MKIAVIVPGALPEEAKQAIRADMLTYAEPGTAIDIFAVDEGKISVAADLDLKAPATVALAQEIEQKGYDAILLDGTCDFCLAAARSAVRIPVVGAASATYHLVYQLGGKYAVISVNENLNPTFLRAIKLTDCENRLTSMRSLKRPFKVPMDSLPYSPEELEEEIAEIASQQVSQEGAQIIVVAFTLLNLFVKPGALDRMSKRLNAIFVDAQAIGIKTAEMMVRLQMSHSVREYPLI